LSILAKYAGDQSTPDKKKQHDRSTWPSLRQYFTQVFFGRTKAEWTTTFIGTDACCVPVLTRDEAAVDGITPSASKEAVDDGEIVVPHPAPTLSRTPGRPPHGSVLIPKAKDNGAELLLTPGEHSNEVLTEWADLSDSEIRQLWSQGAVGGPDPPEEKSRL
jgi:alpha-methylacyl-CoA racemase